MYSKQFNISPDEKRYWIAWSYLGTIGPRTTQALLRAFGTLTNAWSANAAELHRVGLSEKTVTRILKRRKEIDAQECVTELEKLGITALCLPEASYPELLRQSPAPPSVLYLKGRLAPGPALAIVGTRKMSRYGQSVTRQLTEELTRAGLHIVSGLALGIDAVAHESCYRADGQTWAVFGSGVDEVYPAANFLIAKELLERDGAWVSEFPPRTQVVSANFPQRNRIIAGLSLGTLVIEAGEKSGALITARAALDANREVFVVPGPITSPQSSGSNRLLQQGANVVLQSNDVLNALNIDPSSLMTMVQDRRGNVSEEEAALLALFGTETLHLDQLIERSKLPSQRVLMLCAQLEMKGCIRAVSHSHYMLQR